MRSRFAALWAAFAGSSLADGLYQVALPLAALQAGGGAGAVAAVLAVSRVSWVLLALPAGVLVDRTDRRAVMQAASLVRIVATLSLAVTTTLGWQSLPVLLLAAFVMGTCEVLFDTALHSTTPAVVRPDGLGRANGRLQTTETVANQMLGPALGGLLVGLSVGLALGSTALLYVCAVVAVRGLDSTVPRGTGPSPSVWASARAGLGALRRDPPLLGYAVGGLMMNTAFAAALAALPVLALDQRGLGLDATGYGLLLTAMGAGGALTGLLVEPWVRLVGSRAAIATSTAAVAIGLGAPAVADSTWAVAGGLALTGAIVVVNVVTVSYRQQVIPGHLLGRVTSAYRLLVFGGLPAGSALAGVVGTTWGSAPVFAVSATLAVLAGSLMVLATARVARTGPRGLERADQPPLLEQTGNTP